MIYVIGLVAGFINGLFSTGAGNIIILYLIFIKKMDTHVGRAVSVAILSMTSVISIIELRSEVKVETTKVILLILMSGVAGIIGSKIMQKSDSKILNLISSILVAGLAIYGLCR